MSSRAPREHPPKPRLTLRVGITGKRAVAAAQVDRIRASLAGVFDALGTLLKTCHGDHRSVFSAEPALLRIITGMAEGSDQLAASVAVERFDNETRTNDRAIATRLGAILPFVQAEYEKDFRNDPNRPKGEQARTDAEWQDSVNRFRAFLDHPVLEAKLEISDETVLNSQHPDDRNLAYAALGDLLREHTDVLVAVSDDIDGGPGGTVDVIRVAVREGIPVIKISTRRPEIFSMRVADPDAPDQMPKEDEKIEPGRGLPGKLEAILNRMLEPPKQPVADDVPVPPHGHHSHEEARPARMRIETYFSERFASAYFSRIFKAFRDAMTVQPGPFWRRCPSAFAAFRAAWRNYRVAPPDEVAANMWPPQYDPLTVDGGAQIRRVLASRHGWADALAVRYADATRSTYIGIAVLGALAVLVGLLALLGPEKYLTEIKIVALLLEGMLLAAAGYYVLLAHGGRWHERMIEYRAIAELLRHQRFVHVLGGADRLERTSDRTWREPDAWVGWYVRATLRELGFPTVILSADHRGRVLDAFRHAELDGNHAQIAYNRSLAAKFNLIDARLGKLVSAGFKGTLWAAGLGVLVLTPLAAFGWFHWEGHEEAHEVAAIVKPYFTVIMAFVPALIAAVHGIRFQMEFKNTADRAAATGSELSELAAKLSGSLAPGTLPGRRFIMSYVRLANEAMSSDLSGWSNVYRGKAPEPP